MAACAQPGGCGGKTIRVAQRTAGTNVPPLAPAKGRVGGHGDKGARGENSGWPIVDESALIGHARASHQRLVGAEGAVEVKGASVGIDNLRIGPGAKRVGRATAHRAAINYHCSRKIKTVEGKRDAVAARLYEDARSGDDIREGHGIASHKGECSAQGHAVVGQSAIGVVVADLEI